MKTIMFRFQIKDPRITERPGGPLGSLIFDYEISLLPAFSVEYVGVQVGALFSYEEALNQPNATILPIQRPMTSASPKQAFCSTTMVFAIMRCFFPGLQIWH